MPRAPSPVPRPPSPWGDAVCLPSVCSPPLVSHPSAVSLRPQHPDPGLGEVLRLTRILAPPARGLTGPIPQATPTQPQWRVLLHAGWAANGSGSAAGVGGGAGFANASQCAQCLCTAVMGAAPAVWWDALDAGLHRGGVRAPDGSAPCTAQVRGKGGGGRASVSNTPAGGGGWAVKGVPCERAGRRGRAAAAHLLRRGVGGGSLTQPKARGVGGGERSGLLVDALSRVRAPGVSGPRVRLALVSHRGAECQYTDSRSMEARVRQSARASGWHWCRIAGPSVRQTR